MHTHTHCWYSGLVYLLLIALMQGCPQSVYHLMRNCWHAEKNDRPTFADIVKIMDQLLENNMQMRYTQFLLVLVAVSLLALNVLKISLPECK